MKVTKKILSAFLCIIMVFCSIAIGEEGFIKVLEAFSVKAIAYSTGDYIYFGTYPQSRVTDSSILSALNGISGTWKSYGYFSGNGNYGSVSSSNYMRYKDVSYNGNKYRAVTFDTYRPTATICSTGTFITTYQDINGYYYGNIYWFRYDPIKWRILDPSTGLIMCASIIDAQPYNNLVYSSGSEYYGDSSHTYYASNYSKSSIRQWLNNTFYNTAFDDKQKANIIKTNNLSCTSSDSSSYDSPAISDKIFLLSRDDVLNSSYGFSNNESRKDSARQICGTDYAACQGCYCSNSNGYGGCYWWWIRNPSSSKNACDVSADGQTDCVSNVYRTVDGVVPALRLSTILNSIYSASSFSTSISYPGQTYWYKFTPSSSGTYVIYSTGSSDTKVQLFNSSGSEISTNDDGGDNTNFRLEYSLTSGTTYYYGVKYYSSSITGTIPVKFGPVYTISYNANGGSGAPSSQKKDWGKDITLSSTKPTRSGYSFLGWSTNSSATMASYNLDSTFSSNGNYTLYAVWALNDTTNPTGSISSTNNVAASQTVTLSLSDNVGVAGYYWGTSSTYSSNTYTATSSSSVTKTISSAGTYYLTVKDTSGNVSSNYSITFYKTTLNANGGSVSPTSVLTKSGNSFTFPTPTKSGYTYSGWATSSTATSGVKSLTPNSNSTYYAVWKSVSQRFNQSNRYSFKNSHSCFFGHDKVDGNKDGWCDLCHGSYYLNESDYNKLISYIKKYDSSSSSTISNVQNLMYSSWGGSCYGMAATAVLDYQNKIGFNENFGNGAKTLWDVKSPSTDKNVMSAINYYMVSQKIGFVRNSSSYYDKDYYPSSWTPGLKKLVSTAQKGEPFLFCYYWTSGYNSYGHAIVAYDCTTNSDGSFSVIAYDNRYPNKDVIIKVNSNYTSCVVNGNENAEAFEIYNDMSAFDKIDIDGPKNDMKISYDSYTYSGASDEISIVVDGDVTVTNALGETISIVNGDISSTMDILSVHMVVRSTEDGEPAPAEFVFEVGHSQSYYFESDNDNMDVSVKTNNIFGSATSENADYIAIGDDGVYVIGNNMNYSAALSSKDNGYDTVVLEGTAKRDVSLTYSGSNILISGVNGKDETISIFAHDAMVAEDYEIKEGYSELKVVTENNDIDIKGSSNSDGRFDISVLKKGKVNSVSINNIEMNYKSSAKINPVISADSGVDYKVEYKSSNASVATVDQNGNVYGAKRGNATITCTVTDEYGNSVSDTCTVNVKYAWWQRIIKIVLFGWIWY